MSMMQDLEEKLQHIEQFCPILVDTLCRITKSPAGRKKKASDGLMKMVDDEGIARVLAEQTSCRGSVDALISESRAAGGVDNVTIVVARVGAGADGAGPLKNLLARIFGR